MCIYNMFLIYKEDSEIGCGSFSVSVYFLTYSYFNAASTKFIAMNFGFHVFAHALLNIDAQFSDDFYWNINTIISDISTQN